MYCCFLSFWISVPFVCFPRKPTFCSISFSHSAYGLLCLLYCQLSFSHPMFNAITAPSRLSITAWCCDTYNPFSHLYPPYCVLMVSSIIKSINSFLFDIWTYGVGSLFSPSPISNPCSSVWLSPRLPSHSSHCQSVSGWVTQPPCRLGGYSLYGQRWLAVRPSGVPWLERDTYRGCLTDPFERWETVTGWQRCRQSTREKDREIYTASWMFIEGKVWFLIHNIW